MTRRAPSNFDSQWSQWRSKVDVTPIRDPGHRKQHRDDSRQPISQRLPRLDNNQQPASSSNTIPRINFTKLRRCRNSNRGFYFSNRQPQKAAATGGFRESRLMQIPARRFSASVVLGEVFFLCHPDRSLPSEGPRCPPLRRLSHPEEVDGVQRVG